MKKIKEDRRKLQYNITREVGRTKPLSSGKIDKYEYFTSDDILPTDQIQMIQ